jgi:protein TonB
MAGNMFQELVSPRAGSRRSWYTVAIAFLVHTAILVTVIVAPLVATDVLPTPREALQFISSITPVMPSPPPVLPRRSRAPDMPDATAGVPLVAPDAIGQETAIVPSHSTIATDDLGGFVTGFGDGNGVIDVIPPPAPAAAAPPVQVGGDVRQPRRVKDVAPEYPQIARNARIEGIVIIQATIGTDGRVEDAKILRSRPFLDEAALAAVRQWEYTPTLLNGVPVRLIMTVTVHFRLN